MDWIQDIICHILENYHGRRIVLWGKFDISDKIKEKLQNEYHINNVCYIDSNEMLVDNREVFSTDLVIKGKKTNYIVIPLAVHNSIKEILSREGYEAGLDFYYFSDCAIRVSEDYYEDAHGNKFFGRRDGIRFCFSGWNSTIVIGKNAIIDKNMPLYMHNGEFFELGEDSDISKCTVVFEEKARIRIGNNVVLRNFNIKVKYGAELIVRDNVITKTYADSYQRILVEQYGFFELGENSDISNCKICFKEKAKVHIGNNVILRNCNLDVRQGAELIILDNVYAETYANTYQRVLVRQYGKVVIGKGTSIGHSFIILCPQNTEIVIGNECLISWNLSVLSNDGHTIFDVNSRKAVNIPQEGQERKVEVGYHVWIGANCIVLYGTYIGEGSIVGAGSLVKGNYPNNCILAGNVAKVIKKDMAWCMDDGEEDISACGNFVNFTEEI